MLTAVFFFAVALLYSSVGHAGASGYLMVMAFSGFPVPQMRPTALVLNLFVASVTVWRFGRAGFVRPNACVPILLGSIPLAFVGGATTLPADVYRILLALCLATAAARLLLQSGADAEERGVPRLGGLGAGASIGLLAGLTGTGGGIFLTPFLVFMRWQGAKAAAGTSALFILANSVAGLAAKPGALAELPEFLPVYVAAALAGGLLGSTLGSQHLEVPRLRQALALVLVVAAIHILPHPWPFAPQKRTASTDRSSAVFSRENLRTRL